MGPGRKLGGADASTSPAASGPETVDDARARRLAAVEARMKASAAQPSS